MDVRCSRCGTEYDFDDALVSERGTTVKCTNCSYQFKVYPGGTGGVPERWIVRKASGRELVYTSLRDLQRAIAQRQVGPADLLSRGGGHPLRPLASIAELEPFFQAQGPATADVAQRTLLGVAPAPNAPPEATVPDYSPYAEHEAATHVVRPATATPVGGVPARRPPPQRPAGAAGYAREEEPKTVPRNAPPERQLPEAPAVSNAAPYAGGPPAQGPGPAQPDGMSAAFRAYQDSFSDESLPNTVGRPRSSALRWIVGILLIGGLAFVGGTVGVRYAKQFTAHPAGSAPPPDNRVQRLLEQGDEELSRGDFETAKEQFDKASALAEQNPAVLSALARLEAARADTHWLSLRLVDPNQKSEVEALKAELDQRLVRVRKAADAAAAVAPNDPNVVRARIDALRLGGDVARARELVGTLSDSASQPDTAYVFAALDMAEPKPAWQSIIDRMRTAASAERGPGRARAALVYALATSGATEDAKAELAKIQSAGAPNVVFTRLRDYVARVAPLAAASASATTPAPSGVATAAGSAPPGTPGAPGAAPGDFRKVLEQASVAKNSGDLDRAESLYHVAAQRQPGNVEALAGLGDVARLQGNTATASTYYDQVLAQNPSYLPALIANADLKWAAGNRPAALLLYRRVASQTDPGTPYGQRAAARIAEAAGSASEAKPQGEAPEAPPKQTNEPPPSPPPAPQNTDTPNNIDTSDLPGFNK